MDEHIKIAHAKNKACHFGALTHNRATNDLSVAHSNPDYGFDLPEEIQSLRENTSFGDAVSRATISYYN